ncbi:MAG: biotin--[acetyl-CoA-carboxylase] ligase [Candidatus Thorarchaeota archaeon]
MLDVEMITSRLLNLNHRVNIQVLESVESTNLKAKELIQNGEEDVVVIAQEQTAGRGRLDRTWTSPPGGIYLSLTTQPNLPTEHYPLLTLLAGCAVVEALRRTAQVAVSLKWPNDLMLEEKKLGGILTELIFHSETQRYAVIGIGININFSTSDLQQDLQLGSTTLQTVTGKQYSLECIIVEVVDHILSRVASLEDPDSGYSVVEEWTALSSTLGRRVTAALDEDIHTGLAARITQSGSLVIVEDDGTEFVLDAGDVIHLNDNLP